MEHSEFYKKKNELLKSWIKNFGMNSRNDTYHQKLELGKYEIKNCTPFKSSNPNGRKNPDALFTKTLLANFLAVTILENKSEDIIKAVLHDCPGLMLNCNLNYNHKCQYKYYKYQCLSDISISDGGEFAYECNVQSECKLCPVKWLYEALTLIENDENYKIFTCEDGKDYNIVTLYDLFKKYEKVFIAKSKDYYTAISQVDYIEYYEIGEKENEAIDLLTKTKKLMEDIMKVKSEKSVYVQCSFIKYCNVYLLTTDEMFNSLRAMQIYCYPFRTPNAEIERICQNINDTIGTISKDTLSDNEKEELQNISEYVQKILKYIKSSSITKEINSSEFYPPGFTSKKDT